MPNPDSPLPADGQPLRFAPERPLVLPTHLCCACGAAAALRPLTLVSRTVPVSLALRGGQGGQHPTLWKVLSGWWGAWEESPLPDFISLSLPYCRRCQPESEAGKEARRPPVAPSPGFQLTLALSVGCLAYFSLPVLASGVGGMVGVGERGGLDGWPGALAAGLAALLTLIFLRFRRREATPVTVYALRQGADAVSLDYLVLQCTQPDYATALREQNAAAVAEERLVVLS